MLSDIPSEIVFYIAEAAGPEACFRLAFTSRFFWEACTSLVVKHRLLSKTYRVATTKAPRAAWELLNTILKDPDVAYHIKEMNIGRGRDKYYDPQAYPDDPTHVLVGPPSQDADLYVKARDGNQYLCAPLDGGGVGYVDQGEEREIQELEMREGNEGAIIPILLSLLPRLRILRYTPTPLAGWASDDRDWKRSPSFWMMHFIRKASAVTWKPVSSAPFHQLTTICIEPWDPDGPLVSWGWVFWCCNIPTLRRFFGSLIGNTSTEWTEHEVSPGLEGPEQSPRSNVEQLRLTKSNIASEYLGIILRNFKKLLSLQYEHSPNPYDGRHFNPRSTMWAVAKYCAHSLQDLVIYDGNGHVMDNDGQDQISLCNFKYLQVLRCTYSILDLYWMRIDRTPMVELEDGGLHLVDKDFELTFVPHKRLPASLKYIHLEGGDPNLKLNDKIAILDAIIEAKSSALPNLEVLYLSYRDFWEGTTKAERLSKEEKASKIRYLMDTVSASGMKFTPSRDPFASGDENVSRST